MTDLHTHILYDVDDGSDSFEMSMAMLEIAGKSGTKNIVLTPHCNIPGGYLNYMNDVIIGRFEKIKNEVKKRELDINVYLGMEVYASNDIVDLVAGGMAITLNSSRYLLTEFAFEEDPLWVSNILGKIQSTGLVPVLAHPERYTYVQRFPQMVYDWVNSGCVIQINRGSLLGKFGERAKNTVALLLSHNLVHIVASDGHKPYRRAPVLNDAYDWTVKHCGVIRANKLFKENPECVLKNKKLEMLKTKQF